MSKRRVLMIAAVAGLAAVLAIESPAQAGLLSQATANGGSAAASGAGIPGVISVANASANGEGTANASLLNVLGTNVGEAAPGQTPGTDVGCAAGLPVCAVLLQSYRFSEEGDARAGYRVATIGGQDLGSIGLLTAEVVSGGCGSDADSSVADVNGELIDPSAASDVCA